MDSLISQIPKPPRRACQAQIHRLAGNVTVKVEVEPFESIVCEEEVSNDNEDGWHPGEIIDYPCVDRQVVRRAFVNFSGRRVKPTQRPGFESMSSQTGAASNPSEETTQSGETAWTDATSVETKRSRHLRQPNGQKRRPEDPDLSSERKDKECVAGNPRIGH